MEVDYSETTDQKVPEAKKMAGDGNLMGAIETLLTLEKQTRTGGDMHSTSKILVAIVQMCHEAKEWTTLNEHLILLSKKRSQLKAAVTKMVQECYKWVKEGSLPSREIELKLIETLRTITEGKIYVEVERARLTHRLSKMQEEDGDVNAAAKTMQELQVETCGSMERKEKVELILEQMRLCLAVKDYIRAQIISKKVNVRFFESSEQQELKLKFYHYKTLLEQFTNNELIDKATLDKQYEKELREGTGVFDANTEMGRKHWQDLRNRVVEHNIRVIALYYTRLTLKRMAELLALSENETEDFLSSMVVKGAVEAKTDRLEGVVNFHKSKNPNEQLNEWSHDISTLMSLVQKTTHLINKEEMVHKHMRVGGPDNDK